MARKPKIHAIYSITHLPSCRTYIGSAIDVDKRIRTHRKRLHEGTHHCSYLQRIWDKYPEDEFKFDIVEEASQPGLLLEREQYHIDLIPDDKLLNSNYWVESTNLGRKVSAKTKKKMRESAIEVGKRPEVRAFRSAMAKRRYLAGLTSLGKPHSPKTKAKMRKAAIEVAKRPGESERRSALAKLMHSQGRLGRKPKSVR